MAAGKSFKYSVCEVTMKDNGHRRLLRYVSGTMYAAYKGTVYFLSFLGPVLLIDHFRWLPVPALLGLTIVGFGAAGVVFLLLLVLTQRLLIGPVRKAGRTKIHTRDGKRWFAAASSANILVHSPFR